MNKNPLFSRPAFWLAAAAALALAAIVLLLPASSTDSESMPPVSPADAATETTLSEGGELLQTFTYTRCEHAVTRRLTAPVELYGKNLKEVEALYPEWRITAFSPVLVTMEQQPDLFCPDHLVVMPNAAGMVCVFENKYGDALALVRELELKADQLPAAVQEEIVRGLGFSTAAELEMWLESVES